MLTDKDLINRFQAKNLKVLIFDFDGTLLDINKPLKQAIETVFKDYSIQANIDLAMVEIGALLESIQGYPIPKIVLESHTLFKYISSLGHLPYLKKLRIGIKIFTKYLELSKEAKLFSGVKTIIQELSKSFKIFIVSHSKQDNVVEHLEKEGIREFFSGVFGSDNIPELKPSPDAFLPIFDLITDLKSEDAVMIGDMPTDIQAGKEAGFWTIGIASGISDKEILMQYQPDLLVNSFKEIFDIIEKSSIPIKEETVKIKS